MEKYEIARRLKKEQMFIDAKAALSVRRVGEPAAEDVTSSQEVLTKNFELLTRTQSATAKDCQELVGLPVREAGKLAKQFGTLGL